MVEALGRAFTPSSGWYRCDCPLCLSNQGKEDRRQSLALNSETGGYVCHRCGSTGRISPSALSELSRSSTSFSSSPATDYSLTQRPPPGFFPLTGENLRGRTTLRAQQYLMGRGIGPKTWEDTGMGVCISGHFARRVVVPIFDRSGQDWQGFVARDYTGQSASRYLYPKGMKRAINLFNHHLLARDTEEPVLVVEGVFDALPHADAVALLGKPSRQHPDLIARTKRPIVVCLDGDAWEVSQALYMQLKLRGARACWIHMPPDKDPGDTSPEEMQRMIRAAMENL